MFDIGFPELMLVSVVALLVIGPEKLPGSIRTLTLWIGRIRRSFNNIKAEVEREIGADEIRQQLHNESIMQALNDTRDDLQGAINDGRAQINDPLGIRAQAGPSLDGAIDDESIAVENLARGQDARDPKAHEESTGSDSSQQTPATNTDAVIPELKATSTQQDEAPGETALSDKQP